MGLLLDPRDPVEHRIEDVVFKIKVLTQRERIGFLRDLEPVQKEMAKFEADEAGKIKIPLANMPDVLERAASIVLLGVLSYKEDSSDLWVPMDEDDLDRIPFDHWSDLFTKVAEVNLATEEDAKN